MKGKVVRDLELISWFIWKLFFILEIFYLEVDELVWKIISSLLEMAAKD